VEEQGLTLREAIRELSVLVPAYGKFSVDARMERGDTPLIFQSPNPNGISNLEQLAENERTEPLTARQRRELRDRELLLKKAVFLTYHVVTSAFIIYEAYRLAQRLF